MSEREKKIRCVTVALFKINLLLIIILHLSSLPFWILIMFTIFLVSGDDPFMFWVFGTNIFTMLVYWMFGGFYTFMDLTNCPAFLRKYKIQPGTNEPVERARLLKVKFTRL